jgi:ACS family tartrate transporter-like MFS transporter
MPEPKTTEFSSSPTGRSALRKATWRLIPRIALGYGRAYMDRANIYFAALHLPAAVWQ